MTWKNPKSQSSKSQKKIQATSYELPNPDFPVFWRLGIGVCDFRASRVQLPTTNYQLPDQHRDHHKANDPPKKDRPGAAATGAKFFFHEFPVVEIFGRQIEGVLGGFIAPAAALVGTAMGAGFSPGWDEFAANGTIAGWLEGHGRGGK
jgi:hypothetical protein